MYISVSIIEAIALQRYRSRASLDRSGARLVQYEATLMKIIELTKSLSMPHQVPDVVNMFVMSDVTVLKCVRMWCFSPFIANFVPDLEDFTLCF